MSDPDETHVISTEMLAFIHSRRRRHCTTKTIDYYSRECTYFVKWLQARKIDCIEDMTRQAVDKYFEELAGHRNPGGVAASFRAVKAFVTYVAEGYDDWKNPMRRMHTPPQHTDPIRGISMEDFKTLLDTCDRSLLGRRDRAVMMLLLDTGLRRNEALSLNYGDIRSMATGEIWVRETKGGTPRTVFFGEKTRRALSSYFKLRGPMREDSPLIATKTGTRMSEGGIRQILVTRYKLAKAANKDLEEVPSPHDFRRAFAVQYTMNDGDPFTLARLLGHRDISMTKRYQAFKTEELGIKHREHGPVDNL